MNMVFRKWDKGTMAPFFDYLYSPTGQRVLAQRLVPVSARQAGYSATYRT